MQIGAIVAITDQGVLGNGLELPWPPGAIKGDLPHFKKVTLNSAIVMGRNTRLSLGKALPGRLNLVVSSQKDLSFDDAETCLTIQDAIERAKAQNLPVWLIGGALLLESAAETCGIDCIWITRVHSQYEGDVYLGWTPTKLQEMGFALASEETIADGLATKEFWTKSC